MQVNQLENQERNNGVSPKGKALDFDSSICKFESCYSSFLFPAFVGSNPTSPVWTYSIMVAKLKEILSTLECLTRDSGSIPDMSVEMKISQKHSYYANKLYNPCFTTILSGRGV